MLKIIFARRYSNITAVTNALVGEGPDLSANGFVDQLILQRQPPGERGFEDAACSTFDG